MEVRAAIADWWRICSERSVWSIVPRDGIQHPGGCAAECVPRDVWPLRYKGTALCVDSGLMAILTFGDIVCTASVPRAHVDAASEREIALKPFAEGSLFGGHVVFVAI